MEEFISSLQNTQFQKRIDKLVKKFQHKKVIFYGAGQFFDYIKKHYDISGFNIAAVTDKMFINVNEPYFDEKVGYNVISPLKIHELKPDAIILSVYDPYYVESYICNELFTQSKYKFKYYPLYKESFAEKLQKALEIEGI